MIRDPTPKSEPALTLVNSKDIGGVFLETSLIMNSKNSDNRSYSTAYLKLIKTTQNAINVRLYISYKENVNFM